MIVSFLKLPIESFVNQSIADGRVHIPFTINTSNQSQLLRVCSFLFFSFKEIFSFSSQWNDYHHLEMIKSPVNVKSLSISFIVFIGYRSKWNLCSNNKRRSICSFYSPWSSIYFTINVYSKCLIFFECFSFQLSICSTECWTKFIDSFRIRIIEHKFIVFIYLSIWSFPSFQFIHFTSSMGQFSFVHQVIFFL